MLLAVPVRNRMVSWWARRTPRSRQLGIRAWSVLIAVVVVGLALLAGASGLVYVLQAELQRAASSAAATRAAAVAAVIMADDVDTAAEALATESRSGQFVQVVAVNGPHKGKVVAASNRLVATTPLSAQRPSPGKTLSTVMDLDNLGEGGGWLVVSRGMDDEGDRYVVQVAVPLRVQRQTVQTVAAFLLLAAPLLLGAVGLAVWLLVGRALQSVERIRAEVATIDAGRLSRRVAVPGTHDEIAALAATMNVMLDRLESAQRAQRAFVSDASHELRSPLATLTTATELAVTTSGARQQRLLATAGEELIRLRRLVDNLMTLARADAQDLLGARTDVDLDDLVDREVRRLRSTSRCQVAAVVTPVRVRGDEARLAQALRNLVDNAERHARSALRLQVQVQGQTAVLQVDNDGDPVAVADRERVFERFVRLDESRSRDAGGSGLGLAITRSTAISHGGAVVAGEAPDGWCRFEIRLPAVLALSDEGLLTPPE